MTSNLTEFTKQDLREIAAALAVAMELRRYCWDTPIDTGVTRKILLDGICAFRKRTGSTWLEENGTPTSVLHIDEHVFQ